MWYHQMTHRKTNMVESMTSSQRDFWETSYIQVTVEGLEMKPYDFDLSSLAEYIKYEEDKHWISLTKNNTGDRVLITM